jgi:hypothetical protein
VSRLLSPFGGKDQWFTTPTSPRVKRNNRQSKAAENTLLKGGKAKKIFQLNINNQKLPYFFDIGKNIPIYKTRPHI